MLKSNKNKIIVSIVAVVLMIVAAVIVSVSLKGEEVKVDDVVSNEATTNLDDFKNAYVTNVDRIIQNANDADLVASGKDIYNVVQLVPNGAATTGTALESYITSGKFADEVLHAHRTSVTYSGDGVVDITIDNKKIVITTYNIDSLNSLIEAANSAEGSTGDNVGALNNADLIYVACPVNNTYFGTNDFSEVVYNFLHTYAVGKDKPIIIDDTVEIKAGSQVASSNVINLCTNVLFERRLVNTPPWIGAWTNENFVKFLNGGTNGYSAYGKINNSRTSGFDYDSKFAVLVIKPDSTDYSGVITAETIKNNAFTDAVLAQNIDVVVQEFEASSINAADGLRYTYSVLDEEGNVATDENGNIIVESVPYSMVFIAPGDYSGNDITSGVYSLLQDKANNSPTHRIIYASDLRQTSTASSGNASVTNFTKLLGLLVTDGGKGTVKYNNVLKVSNGYFVGIAGNSSKADAVANVINAGAFRDYGGTGAKAGKKFTVLEIQPCYPIDISLATKQNDYFKVPADVMFGVTADEIPSGTEYYDFDISKAKIAQATGIPYNQIELVQVSTEALIGMKDDISDTYDLVYIGGNASTLTDWTALNYGSFFLWGQNLAQTNGTTAFGMYTHTGQMMRAQYGSTDVVQINGDATKAYGNVYTINDGGTTKYIMGEDLSKYNSPQAQTTYNTYNGNDLTTLKLQELIEYVDAGFPIMLGTDVWGAYSQVSNKGKLAQLAAHDIDPDSNMFKFLEYVNANKDGMNNILVGFNYSDVTRVTNNDTNIYGNTVTADVEVFSKLTNDSLITLINSSEARPTFEITKCPVEYIEGDTNTYISYDSDVGSNFTFKINSSTAANYVVELYVDEDGNGLFSEDTTPDPVTKLIEWKASVASTGGTGTLAYFLENPDFYGLKNWKLLVKKVDSAADINTAGPSEGVVVAYYTGNARYKRQDTVEKKEVRILQIFTASPGKDKWVDGHSLFLCTECQHTGTINDINMFYDGYGGPLSTASYLNAYGTLAEYKSKKGSAVVNIGAHRHNFGIVKYDTMTDVDDWDSNFADILKEDYEFELDIMSLKDYEAMVKTINGQTEEQRLDNADLADQAYSDYISAQMALEASGTETVLRNLMKDAMANKPADIITTNFDHILDSQEYHEIFYYNSGGYNGAGSITGMPNFTKLVNAYNDYILYKDDVVNSYNDYKEYSNKAYTSEEWLVKNYNMVVIGFSEDFGGQDMTDQACEDLISYEAKDGSILTTHDTTAKYAEGGSVNLTYHLADVFGMDRFHATANSVGLTESDTGAKNMDVRIYPVQGGSYKYIQVSTSNTDYEVTFKLINDGNGNFEYNFDPVGSAIAGNTHSDLTESMQMTVHIYKNDGVTPVVGHTVSASANGATYTGVTDATGTAIMTIPQNVVTTTSTVAKYINYDYPEDSRTIHGVTYPKYFVTNISAKGTIGAWGDAMGSKIDSVGYNTSIARTDSKVIFSTSAQPSTPYKYTEYIYNAAEIWDAGFKSSPSEAIKASGTSKAAQVNHGIVTTYPFYISKQLEISNTHAQTLALDMEDDELIVWYTLGGSGNTSPKDKGKTKTYSSIYAASPYDGMDSYYIYTKGNITYCGAGHSHITGANLDNNDERRLFINVIVNSVRNAKSKPKVTLYDPGSPKPAPTDQGKITLTDSGVYEIPVERKDEYPQFDFTIKVDNTAYIEEVKVYYDLDYGMQDENTGKYNYSDKYVAGGNHPLILEYTSAEIASGERKMVRPSDYGPEITPKEYFENYGGSYTYIVIMVRDSLGQVTYTRIKIYHVLELFDLTFEDANSFNQEIVVDIKKQI